MQSPPKDVIDRVLTLPSLRPGSDFFEGESPSVVVLDLLLNRANTFFAPLHRFQLSSAQIRALSVEEIFSTITSVALNSKMVTKQLASSASVLELLELDYLGTTEELRERLLSLERVGPETADTLLFYVFRRLATVVDTYLKRIVWRHYLIEKETHGGRLRQLINPAITSADDAHRLHARANEIDVDLLLATRAHFAISHTASSVAWYRLNTCSLTASIDKQSVAS